MTDKNSLLKVLDMFDELGVQYYLDGGWGVDVLYGSQTREHQDIDIDYDAACTRQVLQGLMDMGFVVRFDWFPFRAELEHEEYGLLDVHPFDFTDPECVLQVNPDGGYREYPSSYFGEALFEGRKIPCITAEGQKEFHSFNRLHEQGLHDLTILYSLE